MRQSAGRGEKLLMGLTESWELETPAATLFFFLFQDCTGNFLAQPQGEDRESAVFRSVFVIGEN